MYATVLVHIIAVFYIPSIYSSPSKTDTRDKSDIRKQAKKIAETEIAFYSNLDSLLTSAPTYISSLCHLMLIATEIDDFTLLGNTSKNDFRYLKSLVQLSYLGSDAFTEAHMNMVSIRLHTNNLDSHVQTLQKIISVGTNDHVELLVPITLKKIEIIADECLELSVNTERSFDLFAKTINELYEAGTIAKEVYEEKYKDIETVIKSSKVGRESSMSERENMKQQIEDMKKEIKDKQKDFEEAFDEMSSGYWDQMFDEIQTTREEEETPEDRANKGTYRFAGEINRHVHTLVDVATSRLKR
ncbi:unnamed protein product [Mytilus edulis]|uniref:Uncharacterized protein n=1 Tax=Mytilus edulis TaxID=6550 RepID=A0A8S3RJF6_MYTED|nr:unnamed protein product [Mytilus edulis]